MYDLTGRQAHAAVSGKTRANSETDTPKEKPGNIREACRILLPAMQALFDLQIIAVFNKRFAHLRGFTRVAHLLWLAMAPAALRRIAEPGWVSCWLIALPSPRSCAVHAGAGLHAGDVRCIQPGHGKAILRHVGRHADFPHHRRGLFRAALLHPPALAVPFP